MRTWLLSLTLLAAPGAQAQHHAHHPNGADAHGTGTPAQAPYAGMQDRTIKALSEQQLADLRAGRGMALALPAELNGYPGPAHALELADALGMSPAQQGRTQALFEGMRNEAQPLGKALIAAEAALDALFKERKADAETVSNATAEAARAQGRLRAAHLRYHLAMMEVLTPEQVAEYNRLRGYR